jgi:hypothetical protein
VSLDTLCLPGRSPLEQRGGAQLRRQPVVAPWAQPRLLIVEPCLDQLPWRVAVVTDCRTLVPNLSASRATTASRCHDQSDRIIEVTRRIINAAGHELVYRYA